MEGGPTYNAAADLIERNLSAGRAAKTAFIDDRGPLGDHFRTLRGDAGPGNLGAVRSDLGSGSLAPAADRAARITARPGHTGPDLSARLHRVLGLRLSRAERR